MHKCKQACHSSAHLALSCQVSSFWLSTSLTLHGFAFCVPFTSIESSYTACSLGLLLPYFCTVPHFSSFLLHCPFGGFIKYSSITVKANFVTFALETVSNRLGDLHSGQYYSSRHLVPFVFSISHSVIHTHKQSKQSVFLLVLLVCLTGTNPILNRLYAVHSRQGRGNSKNKQIMNRIESKSIWHKIGIAKSDRQVTITIVSFAPSPRFSATRLVSQLCHWHSSLIHAWSVQVDITCAIGTSLAHLHQRIWHAKNSGRIVLTY